MLKFNTFRAKRYLRSRFVEGKYLLASEASDLELELIDLFRKAIKSSIGDVAVGDAWKVEKLSDTELLVKPGEAWVNGLPVALRSSHDQLVGTTGEFIIPGELPAGVTVESDTQGRGKIIKFDGTTPSENYRIVLSVEEELVTSVQDAFIKNANIPETTAQKIRLVLKLNLVEESLQDSSPIPYTDETNRNLSNELIVNTSGSSNIGLLTNQILLTGGQDSIDGRDIEITINNSDEGSGKLFPIGIDQQKAFSNGKLIDVNGTEYHINLIRLGNTDDELVLRIDKEPNQPDPVMPSNLTLPNTVSPPATYKLVKKDVFVTSNTGLPEGKVYWNIATANWSGTAIVHESSVVDLRNSVKALDEFESTVTDKLDLFLVGGGNLSWDAGTSMLNWDADLKLINSYGPTQTISSSSKPMVDGGSLIYEMDLTNGGAIERGTLVVTSTSTGTSISLTGSPDLSEVRVGNIAVDDNGTVGVIEAINDVNDTLTVDTTMTFTAGGTIYLDSYAPQTAPKNIENFVLAVRDGSKVYIGINDLELESGETNQLGDGISAQNLTYIGATGESDDSPDYSSEIVVTDGDSLTTAIGKLDSAAGVAATSANQDRNLEIVSGGFWSWNLGTNTLTLDDDAFVQIPGFLPNRNRILAQSMVFSTFQHCAYVTLNRTIDTPTVLTVSVDTIDNIPDDPNVLIIARRTGDNILLGDGGGRLKDGQSQQIFQTSSNQTLNYIGSVNTADNEPTYSSDIRGTANESLTTRQGVLTDAVGDEQEDRSAYFRSDYPITWTGTELQGTSDIVLDIINTKSGVTTEHIIATSTIYGPVDYIVNELYGATSLLSGPVMQMNELPDLYGRVFTIGSNYQITQVDFSLSNVSSATGTLKVNIVNVDGLNQPDEGSILGSSTPVDVSPLIIGTNIVSFVFSSPLELTAGTYAVVLTIDTPGTGTVGVYRGFGTPGLSYYSTNGGSTWISDNGVEIDIFGAIQITAGGTLALNTNESMYINIDRTATSETVSPIFSDTTPIPAQTQADKDIIVVARRVDVDGIGYLHLPLHKQVLEPGQTVRLGASGAGGEGTGGLQDPIEGYRWLEIETFEELPTSVESKVDTDITNATYDVNDKLYKLECDKTKQVAAGTSGTTFVIDSAVAGFTVSAGDIIYMLTGTQAGEFRKILSGGPTSFVLDSAFTSDPGLGDSLMISQAVWTKDLVNFGDAAQKVRARDFFSGDILQVAVDYQDSLDLGDEVPDYVDQARVVMSASNEGLVADTAAPLSNEFTQSFYERPIAPGVVEDYILSTNADQERLHILFFCNPDNAAVVNSANLIGYEANFYAADYITNGGVINDAICFSDNSTTPVNCSVATPASLTEVTLDWFFIPNVNSGSANGQIEVYVDGKKISRYISPTITPPTDLYYTEELGLDGVYRIVRFSTDLSITSVEIVILKTEGVQDVSPENAAKLAAFNEAVVGSTAQVAAGIATHDSLAAAINDIADGGKILLLQEYSTVETINIDKKVFIEGKGNNSVITGTVTFNTGASKSMTKFLKFADDITVVNGEIGLIITDCWIAASKTLTDNNPTSNDSMYLLVEEV